MFNTADYKNRVVIKFSLTFLIFVLQACVLKAESVSIHIEDRKDYEILDQFFKTEFSEEGYGYVLEGIKPICIRNLYSLDLFTVSVDLKHSEKIFMHDLLAREAIPIWNKLCSHQKNFVLKTVSFKDSEVVSSLEVQFINITSLRKVIDKHIDLFRYILGPTIETEQLVNKIAYSDEPLRSILCDDIVLVGVLLGFGSHNSVVGGRAETINSLTISRDCAPFFPKSFLMQSKKNHSLRFLIPECYGTYYLEFAGGDDMLFRNSFGPLQQSAGFSNIEEELLAIDAGDEPLPSILRKTPAFIFGAYKGGPSNQLFFNQLQKIQKQITTLLKKPDFLEQVLEKIGGKKPRITCEKPPFSGSVCSLVHSYANAQKWIHILRGRANSFESQEERRAFIEAFCQPFTSSPKMIGASKAILNGLKKALSNLAVATAHFEDHSKNRSLQAITAKQLYFKTTLAGSGKELKGEDRVRMGYVIADVDGNILFANYDVWLNLSHTIPAFAHGVQGMHLGEKRTLFIHPALGYGALTTLPPCIELVVQVHLLDIEEKASQPLLPLVSHDFSWMQDPSYQRMVEESIQQIPGFIGSFYRNVLDKIEDLDKTAIIAELDKRASA